MRTLGSCALLVLAASPPVGAQEERPVRWTLQADAADGEPLRAARLVAAIEEGWYLYSPLQPPGGPIALRISLPEGGPYELDGEVQSPRPRRYADRNFNIFSQIYESSAAFGLPLRASTAFAGGNAGLVVLARYQACTRTYCLPPRTDTLRLAVEAADAGAPSSAAPLASAEPAESPPADAPADGINPEALVAPEAETSPAARAAAPEKHVAQRADSAVGPVSAPAGGAGGETLLFGESGVGGADSLAGFLWLAVLMGFVSLLTPCVFPMVPITIGFFTRTEEGGGGTAVLLAGAYAAGIIATFGALGLGVALIFGAAGVVRLAANPWLNLAVAAMFVAFALNLLGVYQVRLPGALVNRAAGAGSARRGAGAAFGMGGAFTLTSFTCTAPFVGTLLVLATQGGWRWPLLGLSVYAAAFALPFFFLALAPDALRRLPRSGPWMQTLKAALGVVEIAAAAKFVSNADLVWTWGVFTREVVIGLWVAAAVVLSGVFAAHAARARAEAPRGAVHAPAMLALGAVAMAVLLAQGLRGARLGELEAFLPPAGEGRLRGAGDLPWRTNDYEGSLALARAEGRPLILDFTGYTCTNCRWMEANMFPRGDVSGLLAGFVRVRLYTDGQGEVYERQQRFQQQRFGTVALPYYAVVDATGRPVAAFLGMTRDPRAFTRFLRQAAAAAGTRTP